MDDTIRIILQIAGPVAAIALAWGGFRWQLKHLSSTSERQAKEFELFKESDRARSHDLNLKLAAALESMSQATVSLIGWEDRRGGQIDRNTQRSRENRTRIGALEDNDRDAALRRLKSAGVPPELHEEITGVMRRAPETSSSYPVVESKAKVKG